MTTPKRTIAPTLAAAHYLGLPTPAAATRVPVPAKSGAKPSPSRPASTARTASNGPPARPAAAKQQGANDSMPFTRLMGNFRAPAREAEPEAGETMSFPEMHNGVATGRRINVHVPAAAAPKIDAAALAEQILAAGRKARGETA